MDTNSKILIVGGTGMVGRALGEVLASEGYYNVEKVGSNDYDLKYESEAKCLFQDEKPEYLFHLAAQVFGMGGNQKYKSDVLYNNTMINTNTLEYARRAKVKKIVAMGSACIYPEFENGTELKEDMIFLGPPHPSEDSYAYTKRLMLAQLLAIKEQYGIPFAYVVGANLYGEHDNFDMKYGHIIPSLIAKFYRAKHGGLPVKVWGTGAAMRDFTYVSDAARALYQIMLKIEGPVNSASGFKHSIRDVVDILQDLTGMKAEWDTTKSNGQLERCNYNLDKLSATGHRARIDLEEGLGRTYKWYRDNKISEMHQ